MREIIKLESNNLPEIACVFANLWYEVGDDRMLESLSNLGNEHYSFVIAPKSIDHCLGLLEEWEYTEVQASVSLQE